LGPHVEIFKDSKYDFYNMDPNQFAPAAVAIGKETMGKSYQMEE
jgi:methenyltetrahydromethanopterin cyclohydrolase